MQHVRLKATQAEALLVRLVVNLKVNFRGEVLSGHKRFDDPCDEPLLVDIYERFEG